jgi:UDP-glucuronate 4-epimerase
VRILLTGAAGFIGSHLAERLCALGHEVVGIDNFDPYYDPPRKEKNVAGLAREPRFRLVRGDLLDAPLMDGLFAEGRFDEVVHLAALAGVRPSIRDPERYMRVDVEATAGLLRRTCDRGIGRFVFASSSSVYGRHARPPFSEDDPSVRPYSPYAAAKRAGELLMETYVELGLPQAISLRYFTVFGPRQRPEMAISLFAHRILAGEPVTLFGDGSSVRDYTYVDDAVEGTVAACLAERPGHHVYNLGGGRTTTLAELVAAVGLAVGREPVVKYDADQPGDVPTTFADVSRAARDLGYAPKIDVREGVRRFVDWMRAGEP